MIISAIAAVAKNQVIGINNKMPWHLPVDLKYFKQTTLNHHLLMGRKNYESIGQPLPKRTNIIITRNPNYQVDGCLIVHSIKEGIDLARTRGETELFIIGGGEIYAESLPLLHRLYITEIDLYPEGDVFFPKIGDEWQLVHEKFQAAEGKNKFDCTFKIFEKNERNKA